MSPNVIDLAERRQRRPRYERVPWTLIVQVSTERGDYEIHRHVGVDDSLTFAQFHEVLGTCFDLPADGAPWHFFTNYHGRGHRIDPQHALADFLRRPGEVVDYTWGLWDFQVSVADMYPRDNGTPRALCVGGSGHLGSEFDITSINSRLTGQATTASILGRARREVRSIIERSGLLDFVPLLQAVDLNRETPLADATRDALSTLPLEDDAESSDAFWAAVLGLSCLADEETTDSVMEATLAALGWVDDDGTALSAAQARRLCADSLDRLAAVGGCGPDALAPVERLDIFRALLRRS